MGDWTLAALSQAWAEARRAIRLAADQARRAGKNQFHSGLDLAGQPPSMSDQAISAPTTWE